MLNGKSLSNVVSYLHFTIAAEKSELCKRYKSMTPAANSDPGAFSRRDMEDLCEQLEKHPESNATSIDQIVVQPAALKRACGAINETKERYLTIEAIGEEWKKINSFQIKRRIWTQRYRNRCAEKLDIDVTGECIGAGMASHF